ncbi:metallophosphoesterase family protein [Sciscionella sediminilitoris]|uniref:metallophosphoesterase family protein n=1 Tax=Sciscionella sediminilitoris TaxID=1445613 RepID=UPI0004DF7BEA|nr:metallophosphoesterase family protein [Sciscionella sp. SE31]
MAPIRNLAVLSDIHGVLPALEAVLADPEVRACERIVLTGDIAAGPQPVPVLERLLAEGDRAVWVRGNADRLGEWAATQLPAEHTAMLAALPHPVTLEVEGFGEVLFCHGTPRSDEEVVLADTRMARWREVLEGAPDTVVCGHTHMPFVRYACGRQIINPGSVGMPYGRTGAHWALLSRGNISLRRTEYDIDRACAEIIAESSFPDVAAWVEEYLRARNTDTDAHETFAPLDGRET